MRRHRSARSFIAAALCLFVFGALVQSSAMPATAAPSHRAQTNSFERIRLYDSMVTIERDGSVQIEEKIDWDFGANEHHGITRDIQTRFRYDTQKKGYDRLTPLDVLSVEASGGASAQYAVKRSGDSQIVRIGDPDRTVTGAHTYTIRYRLRGVLNHFKDHDELYLNAVGNGFGVPIDRATAAVHSPANITGVACFTGPRGSNLACTESNHAGPAATFGQSNLAAYSGVTVVIGFPVGVVPTPAPIIEARPSLARSFALRPDTLGIAGGLLAAVIAAFSVLALRTGRDRRFAGSAVDVAFGNSGAGEERVPMHDGDPIPVEFVPPDNIRPGQVGTLIDEQANPLDVTATIIDLAVRGYLKITEIPKEGWFGKPDWELHQLKDADGLMPYEATLLRGIFEDRRNVTLSGLKDHFATRLKKVENLLYDDVVNQGWYARRPDQTRNFWHGVGFGVLILGALITFLLATLTSYGLVGVPFLIAGLLFFVGSRWFPRRTAKGYGTFRRVLGFKIFIDESEKDRARFAEQQHLFSEYLPYAVVFGVTEKWARAFAGIDGQLPQQGWYIGPGPFTFIAFSSAMDSFAVTSTGTISSVPASSGSSGFGGGGFSGGGFGGGGGGSW